MRPPAITCLLVGLVAFAARADRIVLKNGQVLTGQIVDERDDRLTLEVSGTITVEIRREQVARIIREGQTAPRPGPSERDGPASQGEPPGPGKRKVVCFAQIKGSIETLLLAAELRRGCERAANYSADAVVFEIDTPGGRLDVMQHITALIESLAPTGTVAYVCGGPEGGAFSAGAVIAVSCQKIYMAPGTAIGAAAPIRVTKTGVSPVGQKTISAVTAKVRSVAQKNGYPPEVVAAMVDAGIELRHARVDGRETYLSLQSALKAKPPAKDKAKEPKVELGDWITKKGHLLTLTALEAKRLKIAAATVASRRELLAAMGLGDARTIDLNTTAGLRDAVTRREHYLRKLDARIASYEARAKALDPAKFKYPRLLTQKGFKLPGDFLDDGRLWRRRSDACTAALDACLEACRRKLELARRYPELDIDTAGLRAKMAQLLALRERVRTERGRRGSEK